MAIACNQTEPTAENKTTADTSASAKPADTVKPVRDVNAELEKLNNVLKKYEEQPQHFTVASGKQSVVTGKKGTRIIVDPSVLETEDGKPVGKNIEVELKELTNQTDLLRANAQTMSDGRLLVSGGAYYINMTSDGKKLKIKNGKTVKVQFPVNSDKAMSLFYGERDSVGKMNWKEARQEMVKEKVESKDSSGDVVIVDRPHATEETPVVTYMSPLNGARNPKMIYQQNGSVIVGDTVHVTKEQKENLKKGMKTYQSLYAAANVSRLGWFNCDRDLVARATDITVQFLPSDSVSVADVFLRFKDINSVIGGIYISRGADMAGLILPNVPVGYKVQMLCYTVKDDKIFADASDITISKDMTVTPNLKQMSEEEFGKMIGRN
jgi:hypothetical protein